MAKNNALINAHKAYRKKFDEMVPKIYASMAIALHKEGFGYKRIARVFAESQTLWQESLDAPEGAQLILDRCKELTGIDVMYGVNSKPEDGWHEWDD